METTTKELIEKLEAFKKAFIELSNAWTEAKIEDAEIIQEVKYPFEFSFDEYSQDVKIWVDDSITKLQNNSANNAEGIADKEVRKHFDNVTEQEEQK